MKYEDVLATLKTRLMTPPGEDGPHARAMEVAAGLIVNSPYDRAPTRGNVTASGYDLSEITAGMMIHAMWVSEPKAAPGRRFPTFRVGTYDSIVADTAVGQFVDPDLVAQFGGHLVACGFENMALRDFIIAACNAYREPEQAEPEAEVPFLWYAGADPSKLTHGPYPTRIEAIQSYRAEHRVEAFYLVEGRKPVLTMSPFRVSAASTGQVLDQIEHDAAGDGAALPRLSIAHEGDLADALNGAVDAWGKRHGIKLISVAVEARKVEWIPEVDEPRVPRTSGMCPVVAAKIDLDRAKCEVRDARAKGDHAEIEAARLKVLVARSAVHRARYGQQMGGGYASH